MDLWGGSDISEFWRKGRGHATGGKLPFFAPLSMPGEATDSEQEVTCDKCEFVLPSSNILCVARVLMRFTQSGRR